MKIILEHDGVPHAACNLTTISYAPAVIVDRYVAYKLDRLEKRGPQRTTYAIYQRAETFTLSEDETFMPVEPGEFEDIKLEASRRSMEADKMIVSMLTNCPRCPNCQSFMLNYEHRGEMYWRCHNRKNQKCFDSGELWKMPTAILQRVQKPIIEDEPEQRPKPTWAGEDWPGGESVPRGLAKEIHEQMSASASGIEAIRQAQPQTLPQVAGDRQDGIYEADGTFRPDPPKEPKREVELTEEDRKRMEAMR